MPAPDRSSDVARICANHPEAFPRTDQNDAARLVLLRGVIIPALNAIDGGRWGYLTKTDQRQPDGSYKVPCDIVMDRVTGWLVDCMTGDGPCWLNHEPPPPAWQWTAVDPVIGPPAPTPDASVSVWVGLPTLKAFDEVGTIVPQPDGTVVLIDATGGVFSVQPDGTLQVRAPGTVGTYERAARDGASLLRYDGTGTTYWIGVRPR